MRCTRPRTVGFKADGKTICWSPKEYSKEYPTFQLPCSKCIECRLEYARQWAVRCVHESKMYEKNTFLTLTYSDETLSSPFLQYADFQKFMKRLRKRPYYDGNGVWHPESVDPDPMGVFVTGEYGEKNKRPHWHAIVFNWAPNDGVYHYTNKHGDEVFTSNTLSKIWGLGNADFGSVTFKSAGYVARYAAKKLVHGDTDDHPYQPISRKSSKHAIGKRWLEKHWADVFIHGRVVLGDGVEVGIPRYYEKWLQKNKPDDWLRYVTGTKFTHIQKAEERAWATQKEWEANQHRRLDEGKTTFSPTENQRREIITESKFKQLQAYLKL